MSLKAHHTGIVLAAFHLQLFQATGDCVKSKRERCERNSLAFWKHALLRQAGPSPKGRRAKNTNKQTTTTTNTLNRGWFFYFLFLIEDFFKKRRKKKTLRKELWIEDFFYSVPLLILAWIQNLLASVTVSGTGVQNNNNCERSQLGLFLPVASLAGLVRRLGNKITATLVTTGIKAMARTTQSEQGTCHLCAQPYPLFLSRTKLCNCRTE